MAGLLDAYSETPFKKVIKQHIDAGPSNIILSLAQIDFVDSSGLGALVQVVKHAESAGGGMQIITNPRVTQTVKLVRLEKFLSLRNTLEEAVANIGK